MPEIDIWYNQVDVDKLIGHLAPYDADELGSWIERKAHRRTGRGASTKLTQLLADGRRTIIEDPPFRTHLQAVGDTDPEAIIAGPPTSSRRSPSSVSAKHPPSRRAAT